MMGASQEVYRIDELAKFFHSFPLRYDIQFEPVSSDFKPESKQYQESLLLIAGLAVLWMLLWILIFMVYFCYFCVTCRRRSIEKTRKSARPTRWCSFFFSILAILVLAVSIFGNELVDYSLKSASSDINKIQDGIDKSVLQSAVILRSMASLQNETGAYLHQKFRASGRLDENDRPVMIGHTVMLTEALSEASSLFRTGLQGPLTQVEADNLQLSSLLNNYESYRRITTHAVSGFMMLTTALSLCALGSKKKAFILTCVAISIFNLMLVWVAAGFYAGLTVATGDLCVDPTGYVINAENTPSDESSSVRYYLECQPAINPLNEVVVTIQDHLDDADRALSGMLQKEEVLVEDIRDNITEAQAEMKLLKEQLLDLSSSTHCASSHKNYMSAINSVCHTSLAGETAILGSFTLTGTFIIILVFLMHTAARYNGNSKNRKPPALNVALEPVNRRRRRAYFEVDSQDNDYQSREHNRSDNPLYYRFSQISTTEDNTRVGASSSSTSAAAQPSAPPRSSPPPAYQNHKDFYSTYGNNGTLDSNTRVPTASNDLNRNSNTFRT